QLSSDIKARLLAFQQKRTKGINLPGHASPPAASINKPLPQLPSLSQDHPANKRSLSANDSAPIYSIPSPQISTGHQAPPAVIDAPPQHPTPSNSLGLTSNATPQAMARFPDSKNTPRFAGNPTVDLKKKPSLSQRRGMKLDMSAMANSPPANSQALNQPINLDNNNPSGPGFLDVVSPPLQTTGGISRRLSERKNKPNFKLNLDASNSDLPQHRRSNSTSSDSAAEESKQDDDKKPQLQGLFANYSKYVDIKSGQLNFAGKASLHSKGVDFSSGSSFRISLEDMEYIEELGRGNYGSVSKVLHKPTGVTMAMKEVRLELDESKFTQILMELEILHKCDSPYIVDFYGAFFVEGAVYMCMEYMDAGSLDKVYGKERGLQDEASLAYISECVIRGLKELKDEHNIIHRDVKPTNILVNTLGKIKLCDFGVSGNLVASLAKTNIGCQSYMAPERIKSVNPDDATYSVQSDVWSLGLTILEVAAGHYPYPTETYGNIFSQLSAIVDGDPPKLDPAYYSKEAQMFVKSCLNKNPELRPSYAALLNNSWLIKYRDVDPHMAELVTARVNALDEKKSVSRSSSLKNSVASLGQTPPNIENVQSLLRNKVRPPALHKGGLVANRNFMNR
ncbi:kinase-like protein, partial [Suhomyces tanzawaensis NRRL Y-17324]